jgi:hypothetical protein
MQWLAEDPDDPSDNDPAMTVDAKFIIDPCGDEACDNSVGLDGHEWEAKNPLYPLSDSSFTGVVGGTSLVWFNATDVGGDNFIVKARLSVPRWKEPCEGDKTGIMTMWKRIDVERVRMNTDAALPLSLSGLNEHFRKAFVEWVDQPKPNTPAINPMGDTLSLALGTAVSYCEQYFENKYQGGWFFMASAGYLVRGDDLPHPSLWEGTATLMSVALGSPPPGREQPSGGQILLPVELAEDAKVDAVVVHDAGHGTDVSFEAYFNGAGDRHALTIIAQDYYSDVKKPNDVSWKALADYGFSSAAPNSQVTIAVKPRGYWKYDGWSPMTNVGGNWCFQGRTLMFHCADLDILGHELCHGLGMAHICGHADFTGSNLCLMMYPSYWLMDASGSLMFPGSSNQRGVEFCAEHLKAMRNAHLEQDDDSSRHLGW